MKIERFALGVCFDTRGGEAVPEALWEKVLCALTISDIGGMAVYGGMAHARAAEDSCYICAFTNGSLKQMRRVYRKLLADEGVGRSLYAPCPFIQANALEGIEGLTFFGNVARDGGIEGGDIPFYSLRVREGRRI